VKGRWLRGSPIFLPRKREPEGEDPLLVEARVDVVDLPEALCQESRSHQQDRGQRRLSHHQRLPQVVALPALGTASACGAEHAEEP